MLDAASDDLIIIKYIAHCIVQLLIHTLYL